MENNLADLFSHIKNGEMDYFDDFYTFTKQKVFYLIFSYVKDFSTSEDILQDTYLKFLKYKEKVKLDKNILAYLLEIAKNLSLNYLKKYSKQEDIDNYMIKEEFQYHDEIENTEIVKKMKKILNDGEFQIVILHVLNDMTNAEIAAVLHKPMGTILWAYNNAMKKLRREI